MRSSTARNTSCTLQPVSARCQQSTRSRRSLSYTSPAVGGPYTLFSGLPNGQLVYAAGQASGFYNAPLGQYWDYVADGTSAVYEAIVSTLAQQFSLRPPAPPTSCPSPPPALCGPPLPVATPVITTETLGLPATNRLNHPKFAPNTP